MEPVFESFVSSSYVSLGAGEVNYPVMVLRDTGSAQFFDLESVFPFSEAA